MRDNGHRVRLLVLAIAALTVAACTVPREPGPVPESLLEQAAVPGFPQDIRFWGDAAPEDVVGIAESRRAQVQALYAEAIARGETVELASLALSGGGSDGAYGAGLLNGWTLSGTRPEFLVVTGVSTGALIAPFAFLGPDYDAALREAFTTIGADDVFKTTFLPGMFGGQALADSGPLFALIQGLADEEMFEAIAREHRRGRRLLVGTTHMDAERPVMWNLGAIANSGHPEALELFHRVILASASVPVAFPPVLIEVEAGGERFTEMHADGGTVNQVFLYPVDTGEVDFADVFDFAAKQSVYVIRNGRVQPNYQAVRPRVLDLAGRSVETLIKMQGIGDLYRIYFETRRDGVDFNLAYIPDTFPRLEQEPFETDYMNALFEYAYEGPLEGTAWRKLPPGAELSR